MITNGGGEAEGVDDFVDKSNGTFSCSCSSMISSLMLHPTTGLGTGLGCFWDPVEQLAGGVGGSRCFVLTAAALLKAFVGKDKLGLLFPAALSSGLLYREEKKLFVLMHILANRWRSMSKTLLCLQF